MKKQMRKQKKIKLKKSKLTQEKLSLNNPLLKKERYLWGKVVGFTIILLVIGVAIALVMVK
ncbi:MAG: hypothetical protein HQK53_06305 [Oligoflexia bacterium]|nr:hypothetical protein [Oligoflexia bacterium]